MSKRKSEFKDINKFRRFRGGEYLDTKNLLLYVDDKIYLKDLTANTEEVITAGGMGEGNARFSPDESCILFVSSGQFHVYDIESGEVSKISDLKVPVIMEPIWSPDGEKILFASPCGGNGGNSMPPRKHQDEAYEIENLGYKFDGMGFYRPDSYLQLFVFEVKSGICQRITSGEFHYMHHNWSADGKWVLCGCNGFHDDAQALNMDLIAIEPKENGEVKRLTTDLWMVSYPNPVNPITTPDGKYAIAGFMDPEKTQSFGHESTSYPEIFLFKVAIDGSGAEQIFIPDDDCYQCIQFPYNAFCGTGFDKVQINEYGNKVYFLSGYQGTTTLFCLDINGDGHAHKVVRVKKAIHGIGKIQNGKALVAKSDEVTPENYAILNLETGAFSEAVAQSSKELIEEVAFSQPEDFFVETLDGDGQIHGWIMPPLDYNPAKKYPAMLYVHGGPHPFYTYGFTHEFQMFAAAGYAVIYCNPRGSSGYGSVHQEIKKAFDGRAYIDCLQIVDEACRRYDWIDSDRIGVTGGSYGGYMTNYMATHCKRFKAYITQRSMVSDMIGYATSDMQGNSKGYKNFEEFMVNNLKSSNVCYAENIDRPLLILHGADDLRTPIEGAHQLFVAVKDLHPDLPARMVIYPHTHHDQPSNPNMLIGYYKEMKDWFDKYL